MSAEEGQRLEISMTPPSQHQHTEDNEWLYERDEDGYGSIYYALRRKRERKFIGTIYTSERDVKLIIEAVKSHAYLSNRVKALETEIAERVRLTERVKVLEAALAPFAEAFDAKVSNPKRARARREWSEKMPGSWPIEITVTMDAGRIARSARTTLTHGEGK